MKPAQLLLKKIALSLSVGTILGLSLSDSALSRDTDIYFSNPNAQQLSVKPNVMVIIDTSGSMVDNNVSAGVTRLAAMKSAFNTILDDPKTTGIKMGLMRFSGSQGGPVLFPVADLDVASTSIEGNVPITSEITTTSNTDDAEQAGTTVTTSGGTLNISDNSATNVVGLRFPSITIPTGVTVTGAYIILEANGSDTSTMSPVTVKAAKGDTHNTFATTASDVTTRTNAANVFSPTVSWTPGAWTANEKESVDVTTIVKDLVMTSNSWCSGGSMLFTFHGTGSTTAERRAKSRETSTADAPTLVIQYDPTTVPSTGCVHKSLQVQINSNNDDAEETISTSSSTNGTMDLDDDDIDMIREGSSQIQQTGFRFANVGLPPSSLATITSAYIEFTAGGADSSSTDFMIQGQKIADAPTFSSAKSNISGRTRTTNSVDWAPGSVSADNKFYTPELKTIVTEIISLNTSGNTWVSGNDMVFIVSRKGTNTGIRRAVSHDDNDDDAAILYVNYRETVSLSSTGVSTLTVKERLKQLVNGLQAEGSTPIVDTLFEAGRYFMGEEVLYGLRRGDQSGTDAQYTRVSHQKSYSPSVAPFRASGCTDANLNASACVTEEIPGNPTYVTPFDPGCQNSYIVLLTDGAPTANSSENLIESMIGSSCAETFTAGGVTYDLDDSSTHAKCSFELADYFSKNNLSSLTDDHTVITHTIGFGADVTNAEDVAYLNQIATSGGGSFNTASNASTLVTAFQSILSKINSDPTSFVSPSLSVNAFNKLFNRDEVYFSLFSPQKEVRWPGNVKKFTLCNDTTGTLCVFGKVIDANGVGAINDDTAKILATSTSYWTSGTHAPDGPIVQKGGAGQKVPAYASRKMYTYTGSTDSPATAVDLTTMPVNTTNVTKTMLGNASMTDANRDDIINWMLGKNVKSEKDVFNATPTDRWKFADALHSRPLTVTYGGTDASPVIKIFVGTNDGGLRMVNASTGAEEWIVHIPDFLSKQENLMNNITPPPYISGLDGTPTAYVIDTNGDGKIDDDAGDRVYIYIGERRGGKNIYAFDVTPTTIQTDPTSTTGITPKYKWRIRGGTGNFAALGETWSRPLLTKIRIKCQNQATCGDGNAATADSELMTVLVFAGGYDSALDAPGANKVFPTGSDSMGNAIYIVNPLTGALVWSAGGPSSGANLVISTMTYAIPSDLALLDTNRDGATDRIYVGDTRGQVFRVDLGDQIDPGVTGTGGSFGFRFANISGTDEQDMRKFFYPPDVVQANDPVFSASANYDVVAIVTGDREDPLDKLTSTMADPTDQDPVNNRVYAFRDYDYKTGQAQDSDTGTSGWQAPTAITEAVMYDATSNQLGTLTGTTLTDEIEDNVQNKKGWFVKLQEASSPQWIGEKGLAKPVIFDGKLLFTTYLPASNDSSDACTVGNAEGTGRLYAVDYLSGVPIFDMKKADGTKGQDGILDRFLDVGGGIPSEAVVVIREGGVTALVGTSGGASSPDIDLDMPRYPTYWYQD